MVAAQRCLTGPVPEPDRSHLVAMIRRQARSCAELGSPLYADLVGALADDVAASGEAASLLAGHEQDPGDFALALRVMGAVHRLVLDGRAPRLAAQYPSAGGAYADPVATRTAFLEALAEHGPMVRSLLDQPPQTNEVGRAAALTGGLLFVAARHRLPVRLHEIGTSGGLNLRADRFRYGAGPGVWWGDPASPVALAEAWEGELPPLDAPLRVVDRVGCDLAPVDAASPEGSQTLRSYVWADQLDRLRRLEAALEVAREQPARLVRNSAGSFVAALSLRPGTTTVLWHSVMWQYLGADEQTQVRAGLQRLGAAATAHAPFVHLALEPGPARSGGPTVFVVSSTTWPGGVEELVGTAAPHGLPVRWGNPTASERPGERS